MIEKGWCILCFFYYPPENSTRRNIKGTVVMYTHMTRWVATGGVAEPKEGKEGGRNMGVDTVGSRSERWPIGVIGRRGLNARWRQSPQRAAPATKDATRRRIIIPPPNVLSRENNHIRRPLNVKRIRNLVSIPPSAFPQVVRHRSTEKRANVARGDPTPPLTSFSTFLSFRCVEFVVTWLGISGGA